MLPSRHFIFGTIFSLALLFAFPKIGFIGFFIILASTVLIDVDHYLYYVYKKKDWNLKNAFNWYIQGGKKFNEMPKNQRENIYFGICIFHGIEFIIILFAFSFHFISLLFIIVGFVFHELLDLIESIQKKISPLKVVSLAYLLVDIKNKTLIEDYKIK